MAEKNSFSPFGSYIFFVLCIFIISLSFHFNGCSEFIDSDYVLVCRQQHYKDALILPISLSGTYNLKLVVHRWLLLNCLKGSQCKGCLSLWCTGYNNSDGVPHLPELYLQKTLCTHPSLYCLIELNSKVWAEEKSRNPLSESIDWEWVELSQQASHVTFDVRCLNAL